MRSVARLQMLCIAGVLFAMFGCAKPVPVAVPPVVIPAERLFSEVGSTCLYCLYWPDGTKILIWLDITGMAGSSGGPNQEGAEYSATVREMVSRKYGPGEKRPPELPSGATSGYAFTGRESHWRCITADGKTGHFEANGQTYDLANGNVFLIRTVEGGSVTQLLLDLSSVEVKHESFPELAKKQEVIGKFVSGAKPGK